MWPFRHRAGRGRRRVTGVSFPSLFGFGGGGVQLAADRGDRDVLLALVRNMGAVRVLTDWPTLEGFANSYYTVQTARDLRLMVTDALTELTEDSEAASILERMRDQTNRYLTSTEFGEELNRTDRAHYRVSGGDPDAIVPPAADTAPSQEPEAALITMRTAFAAALRELYAAYQLNAARKLADRLDSQ